MTGNDEAALANTQVHYLSSRHVADEFVLDAFYFLRDGTRDGAVARDEAIGR